MYNSRNKNNMRMHKVYLDRKKREKNPEVYMADRPSKKKIRNWRAILKNLREQLDANLFDSVEELEEALKFNQRFYMKLYISPFSNLTPRMPPLWFRKLCLEGFLEVHNNWSFWGKKLNRPFYLKVWIYEQHFASSEILFSVGDEIKYFEGHYIENEQHKPFPHEDYCTENCNTRQFKWMYGKDCSLIEEADLADVDAKSMEYFERENRLIPFYGFKDVQPNVNMFLLHTGDLWVGEAQ